MKLKLTIAYDGTGFQGSQLQIRTGINQRTVQRELEAALAQILGQQVRVNLAGRTDSGVHAAGQVASLALPAEGAASRMKLNQWLKAINFHLPPDLRVMAAEQVADDFHPRFDARRREYEYRIWNGLALPPHLRFDTLLVSYRLDVAAMHATCLQLVGEHDFAAFAGSTGRESDKPASTVREMYLAECRVEAQEYGRLITIRLVANAFLAHMVRNIVGTLLIVGRGRMSEAEFAAIFSSRERRNAGPTVPPQGLTLVRVEY
jgi:tRNA pseudouridine38-40 synthase